MNPPSVVKVNITLNAEFELLLTGVFFDFDNFKFVVIVRTNTLKYSIREFWNLVVYFYVYMERERIQKLLYSNDFVDH